MNTYFLSCPSYDARVHADTIGEALNEYLDGYDTASYKDGESFYVRVKDETGAELYACRVAADGQGNVASFLVPDWECVRNR